MSHNKAAHTASFAGWTRGQAARLWPRRYVLGANLSGTASANEEIC